MSGGNDYQWCALEWLEMALGPSNRLWGGCWALGAQRSAPSKCYHRGLYWIWSVVRMENGRMIVADLVRLRLKKYGPPHRSWFVKLAVNWMRNRKRWQTLRKPVSHMAKSLVVNGRVYRRSEIWWIRKEVWSFAQPLQNTGPVAHFHLHPNIWDNFPLVVCSRGIDGQIRSGCQICNSLKKMA